MRKNKRDLLSAYIIAHTNDDSETIDVISCCDEFDSFKQFQDIEMQRLKDAKQFSWYIS